MPTRRCCNPARLLGRLATPKLWLRRGDDEPTQERGGERRQVRRPDGTVLHVEMYGNADAPPVAFTHGWGGDATEWYYVKKDMARRFRLVLRDLPGPGRSTGSDDRDFTVDKMARDLDAVLGLAGGRPAVLVGHSIGGMISLTHRKLFPEAMGTRVAGLVLVHTTSTNPVHTKVPDVAAAGDPEAGAGAGLLADRRAVPGRPADEPA